MRSSLLVPALALGVAAASVLTPPLSMAEDARATYSLDRRIADQAVHESSGLTRSTYARDVLWTHNDSGDGPRIFAIGGNGQTRAEVHLRGASANDWEDISSGPRHTLWIGDIGDNGRRRDRITVYRAHEPQGLRDRSVASTRFDLRYPDGAHDAEGIMVHPRTGRLYVISKSSNAAVYRAPLHLRADGVNQLARVAAAPDTVTAAAFYPRGRRFVLSTYTRGYIYQELGGRATTFRKPGTAQGESLTVSRSGGSIFVGSEGTRSAIYRVRVGR